MQVTTVGLDLAENIFQAHGVTETAVLHKIADGRAPSFPGPTYSTGSVTGMPSAVKAFMTATRT
ncbi:hypothetical protein [Rhodovulum sulfidophilum]|uniref:hypothetical protein n=1 Tax=Rhodovulum sulfidophilum TaxID=35806 RepID=UPI001F31ADEB|nr:hypothetical protein [Rhodovulum sulfidophilum]MCE8433770.1 hypothetical protein [Rhodovulum sulfidophilum]